jgi:hypothetical protein
MPSVTEINASSNLKTKPAVSVGSSAAVLLLAANASRHSALLQPLSVDLYIGDSTVTAATGIKLTAGVINSDIVSTGPLYGITASGTADVRVAEVA